MNWTELQIWALYQYRIRCKNASIFNDKKYAYSVFDRINYIRSSVQQQQLQNKTLFNSCERLLLGILTLNKIIRVKYHRHEQKSDLIQHQTGDGLRHASGPVRSNLPPVKYILINDLCTHWVRNRQNGLVWKIKQIYKLLIIVLLGD